MSKKIFLTAEWKRLIMANYCVEPGLIKRFVPDGTEPDTVNGKCFVSLVGFLFDKVRVKGIAFPFHQRFPEVNLRLYVRRRSGDEWKRGVVFIREIVPKPAIAFIANALYGEHYATMPMKEYHFCNNQKQIVRYSWKTKGKWNSLEVESDISATGLIEGSEEEFITEHFWGYTNSGKGRLLEYHVSHPRWNIFKVRDYKVDCNFKTVYGPGFELLDSEQPASVFMAEGSVVNVYAKTRL